MLKEREHQPADSFRGSNGGSSKSLNLLVYSVFPDVFIFTVTLFGPFSSVTVHGPVHQGSSLAQLGFDSSICYPVHNGLPSEPPHAHCCLSAVSTILGNSLDKFCEFY